MEIKIGINPAAWLKSNLTDPSCGYLFNRWLSDISLIGYQGLEIEDPLTQVIDKLVPLLRGKNLSFVGKRHVTRILSRDFNGELRRLEEHIETISYLRAGVVILSEDMEDIRGSESDWQRLCKGMEVMTHLIAEHGLKSAYHGERPDIIMENTKDVGLLFDLERDSFALLRNFINRVAHVHLAFYGERDESTAQTIFNLLEKGYRGWVVIKSRATMADCFSVASEEFENVHSLLTKGEFALM